MSLREIVIYHVVAPSGTQIVPINDFTTRSLLGEVLVSVTHTAG